MPDGHRLVLGGRQLGSTTRELDQFLAECHAVAKTENAGEAVQSLMSKLMSDLKNLQSFMKSLRHKPVFEDPILFRSADLFIFNYCQIPGHKGAPHTHGVWAVVGLYEGQEDNVYYKRKGKGLKEVERKTLSPGEVDFREDDAIHAVSNPLDKPSFALHVYGGDLLTVERRMWNPFTSEELPFELNQFLKYSLEMMQLHPTEMDKC